jgi:hypothetical protein
LQLYVRKDAISGVVILEKLDKNHMAPMLYGRIMKVNPKPTSPSGTHVNGLGAQWFAWQRYALWRLH